MPKLEKEQNKDGSGAKADRILKTYIQQNIDRISFVCLRK